MIFECKCCNKQVTESDLKYYPDVNAKLVKARACYVCSFWLDILERDILITFVDDKDNVFSIGSPNPKSVKGFDGRTFEIELDDGRTIESDNVWHRGRVPAWFKHRFNKGSMNEVRKNL